MVEKEYLTVEEFQDWLHQQNDPKLLYGSRDPMVKESLEEGRKRLSRDLKWAVDALGLRHILKPPGVRTWRIPAHLSNELAWALKLRRSNFTEKRLDRRIAKNRQKAMREVDVLENEVLPGAPNELQEALREVSHLVASLYRLMEVASFEELTALFHDLRTVTDRTWERVRANPQKVID